MQPSQPLVYRNCKRGSHGQRFSGRGLFSCPMLPRQVVNPDGRCHAPYGAWHAATVALPKASWRTGTGTCEKIGFADFSTTYFQYFTLLITGSNSVSSHVPGTIFPIDRHHGFPRLPVGIRDWELGFCNHPIGRKPPTPPEARNHPQRERAVPLLNQDRS